MADLRDYKNKDFSITVNSRMGGIELRFENTMTEEQIAQIKEAGFRWSKRQQLWYAYQNEKTIAYAKSLESKYEENLAKKEIAQPSQIEKTVQLQDLIAELREEIRKQNDKIKELESIIEEKNNQKEEVLLEAENDERMTIDELNQWNEEQELQEEIDDLEEGKNFITNIIEDEVEVVLTEEDLELCKKVIPPNQYSYTLELTQGEEGEFYKQKLKDIAKIARQITTDDELVNPDGTHNVGFHYFVGNTDIFVSEISSDGSAFGYTVLNGDVEMAEWGYQNLEEIINASQWIEMDYHVPEGMTIERMLEEKYPKYYKQENEVEIEQNKFIPSFNILNDQYAMEFEAARAEDESIIVRFYDISKVIPGENDKGRFIQSYYASTLLNNQNTNVGLNLGYGWNLDTETYNQAKEIIKEYIIQNEKEFYKVTNQTKKQDFIFDKFAQAGIEVVTDKDEFEKILKSNELLQKMSKSLSELEELKKEYDEVQEKILEEEKEKNNLLEQETVVNNFNFEQFSKDIQNYEDLIPVNKEIKFYNNWGYTIQIKQDKFDQFDSIKLTNESEIDETNLYYKNISFYISKSNENNLLLGFSENKQYVNLYDFNSNTIIPGQTKFGHDEKIKLLESFKTLCSQKDLISVLHDNLKEKYQSMQVRQQDILLKLIEENAEKKDIIQDKYQNIKNIEKIEARKNILEWATKENYDIAFLNSFSKISEIFGNETKSIGVLPNEINQIFPSITDYNLYAQKDYFIDHWVNHHSELTETIFEELQNVLDNYDDIYRDSQSNNIVFVKQQGRLYDFVVVEQKKDKLVFYDSTFLRQGIPTRFEKITPTRKQELNNTVEVRHISSTAEQNLLDPAAGISTLNGISLEGSTPLSQNPEGNTAVAISDVNDNINIAQTENKSTIQNFITHDGTVYGFAHNNKIYLNLDIVTSEAALHEYTHLWDNYIKVTNPELWNKGKEIFKNTYLWEEIKNDEHYQDIVHDEDLILSECHARITGKIADKILDKILQENGEFTKETVIEWDREVAEYCAKEFVGKDIDVQAVSSFISMTMKDFINGRELKIEQLQSVNQEPTTKKEIKQIREQCEEILQKSDNEITEDDKLILAQYEGAGGINIEDRTSAQVLSEFYTPNNVIEKVWNIVDKYNPNGITVLEPTAGTGKFANNRPNNQFTMHELDETSARINKILHPEATVIQGAYQKQFLDENERILNTEYQQPKYDIVIGNPPYGEYSGKYKNLEGKQHNRYEEYFIEKGLDALKDENSILAFVVPSGFLDSKNDKVKEIIASKGQFVDAYRLPAGTFSTTDVGTDILIMRSWEKVRKEFDRDFTNDGHLITKEEAFKSFQRGNAELLSNGEHFKDHPEKILGEIKQRTNQFGTLVDTVVHHEGLTVQDELNKIDFFIKDIKYENNVVKIKEENSQTIEEDLEELEVVQEEIIETITEKKTRIKREESEEVQTKEKILAPVMTSEEFSKLYGRDFNSDELPIWQATNWEGIIDTSKLSFQEENLLHESENYVEIEPGKFTHKVLFESGDIGAKITRYKNLLENLYDDETRQKELYQKNIEHLEQVAPPKIPMERLHFGLNSTLAEEFMVEHISSDGEIVKMNLQESFILWAKGDTYAKASEENYYWRGGIDFATANISQEDFPPSVSWYDIVEYIDKKSVKADRISTWNKDEDEIKADKAQARREAEEKRMARSETADKLFDKYLHEGLSEELSKKVEAEYNRRFNSYVIPDYSKLPLFIEGMSRTKNNKKFKLYDQQIKGVSFLCNKGNGLLAYDVGVGKTAAGIVATVNQIQTGRSKRPVIIVPNAVYAKWYSDIQELFPNIKVNDLYNLNKESTEKYRNKDNPHKLDIEENSISLITYEGLKNLTFNDYSCENELFDDFSKLLSIDPFEGSSRENAKNADNIKAVIGKSSQVKNTNYVFFEDCEFDNITVDEAHNFKNLWTVPRPKNKGESNEFSGIPSGKPSARALKLFAMTQYTQRHNDDRNVFLLTATPFTNSPLEVYSMLSYVGRKRLIDSGLYSLRDFCNQFAHTKLELGVNSKGEIDQKQVMKDWKELPALQKILTEFIDKVDGEELKEIIRPKKFTHVQELEMSPLQKQMMEIDTKLMNEVKEGNAAAVIVSMNAMRVGLVAPALADPARYPDLELPSMEKLVETSPKLKFVCDSVIDMYKNHPEKGQFIFMPLGQTAHGIVKDYLVAHGIPKETVEIINGSINNTTEKKDKLTQKFNNPKEKCKILIGGKNTSEGIDLNGNSFVMYNCSLGWNPSETIQAEGRIWRQGNKQGHVHCVYPVMNDSIDSLLYQKHDEKRSRINELWTYKDGDTLNIEDINPEDLKFDLIKDPQKRAKLILENGIDTDDFKFVGTKSIQNELNKVNSRIKSFDEVYEKRINLQNRLEEADFNIKRIENNIEGYKNADLAIPEWCKSELKDNRKFKTNYEHQLETIERKLSSWGIKDENDLDEFIPNLNQQKRKLENELQEKQKELPKILKMETVKLNEKKVLLPSISEQRKNLTEDIQRNLRPMADVEPEIRTERFEQMLALKWERGEITTDERDLYSKVGYQKYYDWLDGETESLQVENNIEPQTEIIQENEVEIYTEKVIEQASDEVQQEESIIQEEKVEEEQNNSISFDNGLFADTELDELAALSSSLNSHLKKHQVIYYYEDSGVDEGLDFITLSEAQKEGKTSMKEWNLDKSENGFAVFNRDTKQIEAIHGYFPVEKVFRSEILKINGYKVDESKSEVLLSEIQKSTKEKLTEQEASKEHFDSHVVFATPNKAKKEYADSYGW